jgi:hypothetical protein
VVVVPASVVADVYYGEWTRAALLHCAFQHEGLRQLHSGRRDAEQLARDMEWRGVSTVSGGAAHECAAAGMCELWAPLESLIFIDVGLVGVAYNCHLQGEQRNECSATCRLLCGRIDGQD